MRPGDFARYAAVAVLGICIGAFLYSVLAPTPRAHCCKDCECVTPGCCDERRKGEHKPVPKLHAGLQLHRWYQPVAPVAWSWERLAWDREGKHGRLDFAPLYVVDRQGNVAVCRGAVHGIILVPDDSAKWFRELRLGDLGDLPPPAAEKKDADP
jgi:hypothetical protein